MRTYTPKDAQLQVSIVKNPGDENYTVAKHYHIRSKVDKRSMDRIAHGKLKVLDWTEGDKGDICKAFQHQFQQLGGFQVRLHALEDPRDPVRKRGEPEEVVLNDAQIDAG